jgi:polyphosphate kinase
VCQTYADTDHNGMISLSEILAYVQRWNIGEVPTDDLPRFFQLPPEGTRRKKQIIILDNVIRFCLDEIFKGFFDYDEIAAYAVKLTRDAEYDLSDQLDLSLVDKMSDGLKQRLTAMPVRFVYEREMPAAMISFLKLKLQISSYDAIMPGGRYHNFKDFIGFPNVGRDYLENPKLPALDCRDFDGFVNAFDAITKQDILLYYPYHKFHHFTELVRQAAFDPAVSAAHNSVMANASRAANLSMGDPNRANTSKDKARKASTQRCLCMTILLAA